MHGHRDPLALGVHRGGKLCHELRENGPVGRAQVLVVDVDAVVVPVHREVDQRGDVPLALDRVVQHAAHCCRAPDAIAIVGDRRHHLHTEPVREVDEGRVGVDRRLLLDDAAPRPGREPGRADLGERARVGLQRLDRAGLVPVGDVADRLRRCGGRRGQRDRRQQQGEHDNATAAPTAHRVPNRETWVGA